MTQPRAAILAILLVCTPGISFSQVECDDSPGLWYLAEESPAQAPSMPPVCLALDPPRPRHERWGGDSGAYFGGVFAGFLGHEAGHIIANGIEGTDFRLKRVDFGPIPFFTIEPGRELTPREHYWTASAGFNSQHLINEIILARHPNLKTEDEPFLRGLAQFNFWLSVGYCATGLLGYGPDERDTKGMADSLGWSEEAVSLMILAPALLDKYRYDHPDCDWAKWTSRALKLGIVGLAWEARD